MSDYVKLSIVYSGRVASLLDRKIHSRQGDKTSRRLFILFLESHSSVTRWGKYFQEENVLLDTLKSNPLGSHKLYTSPSKADTAFQLALLKMSSTCHKRATLWHKPPSSNTFKPEQFSLGHYLWRMMQCHSWLCRDPRGTHCPLLYCIPVVTQMYFKSLSK